MPSTYEVLKQSTLYRLSILGILLTYLITLSTSKYFTMKRLTVLFCDTVNVDIHSMFLNLIPYQTNC